MKTMKLLLLFAAAGLMAAACEQAETEDQTVAVESISLDETISEGITLTEGETYDIADLVTVLPENATDKTVTYSSSDTKKATVSEEGVITAVAEGTAEITVTAGDKTATFTVTVKPKPAGTVSVESITLDESIAEGATLETGKTLDISSRITVLPENATDKSVKYSSSDAKVATVSDAGVITAVAEGETEITVTSASDAEVSAKFTLTVEAVALGKITSITATETAMPLTSEIRKAVDLNENITVEPAAYDDELVFASSNEKAATVSAEGLLTVVAPGETVITVSAKSNPEIKAEITVTVNQYEGDYPRFEGDEKGEEATLPLSEENWYWTVTCSLETPLKTYAGRNNSLTAMIDGRSIKTRAGTTNKDDDELSNGTAFCFDQMKSVWAESDATSFTIDMGKAMLVNYFRIQNISKDRDDVQVRLCKFNKIEGSNDGSTFETIATDLSWDNAIALGTTNEQGRPEYNLETENIKFSKTVNYRYLKFSCWDPDCFERRITNGTQGGSGQIAEFYLGYEDEAAE